MGDFVVNQKEVIVAPLLHSVVVVFEGAVVRRADRGRVEGPLGGVEWGECGEGGVEALELVGDANGALFKNWSTVKFALGGKMLLITFFGDAYLVWESENN